MWNSYKGHPALFLGRFRWPLIRKLYNSSSLQNILVLGLVLGTILTTWNIHNLNEVIRRNSDDLTSSDLNRNSYHYTKKYAVYGRRVDSGYLAHVYNVLDKYNYKRVNLSDEWDLLWAHDYPYRLLKLHDTSSDRMINKFPGSGFITNKMNLATNNAKMDFVPRGFQIPKDIDSLKAYAKDHLALRFVQKSNNHRGIKISKLEDLDLKNNKSFVQVYISNPLLVDSLKFDIGIYTILTSVNPLRIYINNEVLFRFCKETYHPFDPDVLEKYVVGDDYTPIWDVPSIAPFIKTGSGFKDSFNAYIRSKGKDPNHIWSKVESAIRSVYLSKETALITAGKEYKAKFFEMVRFDFVIDDDFNVFLMEANMSPNLSSAHFPLNKYLYEQVLYSLFKLVGLNRNGEHMEVSDKNIAVRPDICHKCDDCLNLKCKLCLKCLTEKEKDFLKETFLEHLNKHDIKRIFPIQLDETSMSGLTEKNQMLIQWFKEKCIMDKTFC